MNRSVVRFQNSVLLTHETDGEEYLLPFNIKPLDFFIYVLLHYKLTF